MIPQSHNEFLPSSEEIKARISRLQADLEKHEIALAWIDHTPDRYYYTGSAQDGVLLVPATGEPLWFVRKSLSRAAEESRLAVTPFPGMRGLLSETASRLKTGERLGLSMDVATAALYARLRATLKTHDIADISGLIRNQRAVKSDWEIGMIRRAVDQVLPAFERLPQLIRPGREELAVSADVEALLRKAGHAGPVRIRRPGLELAMLLVTSGASACYTHSFDGPVGGEGPDPAAPSGSGRRVLSEGDTLIADIVTASGGYHGDNARCFFLGSKVPEPARRAHAFCLEALDRLEGAIRPGRSCADVYREVAAWAEQTGEPEGFMGYGDNRVKFFGHGVGLELDEFPVIADRIDLELQPGMIIAVEPKAFSPEIGPVGAENTYLLTESGLEDLCGFPLDLSPVMQ